MEIEIKKMIDSGRKFLSDTNNVESSRYKSWEFCYNVFRKMSENDEPDYDLLALNLAFYLASWGMYRGSTFLLQTNYKIHINATEIIINFLKEHKECLKKENDFMSWENIKELSNDIKGSYTKEKVFKNGTEIKINVTDTLLTKIIMGTVGLVPAYDDNVKKVIKKIKSIRYQTFNEESYNDLCKFYKDNPEFEVFRKEVNQKRKMKYPKMKILDMCLWQYYLDYKK